MLVFASEHPKKLTQEVTVAHLPGTPGRPAEFTRYKDLALGCCRHSAGIPTAQGDRGDAGGGIE
jgi:hypothetical protein